MRTLAVITARGGSKGVPRKNLRMLAGKPLIAHTIECARAVSDRLCGIVVSTDDEEIARVSSQWGAEAPFMRPAELSRDETPSLPVVQHAVSFIERRDGVAVDWILLLQPTSPLRLPQDLQGLLDVVVDGDATSAVMVTDASDHHPLKLRRIEDGWLRAWSGGEIEAVRRQELSPPVYKTNGAGYLSRRDMVMEHNTLYGPRVRPVMMPRERSVDIDTEVDFLIAEALFNYFRRDAE